MSRSLWDSPGLDHATFTASANYLQLTDDQQYVIDNPKHFFADQVKRCTSDIGPEWNKDGEGEWPWE